MRISLIASMARNRVIGKEGKLPWHLPKDMAYFKEKTIDHVLIMGRRTFESIPPRFSPLSRRYHVILSRQSYRPSGLSSTEGLVVHRFQEAILAAQKALVAFKCKDEEVFVIGGESLYRKAMPYATRLYLTQIETEIQGDTYFPAYEPKDWHLVSHSALYPVDERHKYPLSFKVYEKIKPQKQATPQQA